MIRFASIHDLERIVDIYNQAVPHKNATADLEVIKTEQRIPWFKEHNPDSYPIFVKEIDGTIVGWCSLSPYRSGRLALKNTAEIACYIDYGCHGQGIGKELIHYALTDCNRINKRIVLAIVLEKNVRSLKLLKKSGFQKWGYLPEVADFDGESCGHVYMGKKINR